MRRVHLAICILIENRREDFCSSGFCTTFSTSLSDVGVAFLIFHDGIEFGFMFVFSFLDRPSNVVQSDRHP